MKELEQSQTSLKVENESLKHKLKMERTKLSKSSDAKNKTKRMKRMGNLVERLKLNADEMQNLSRKISSLKTTLKRASTMGQLGVPAKRPSLPWDFSTPPANGRAAMARAGSGSKSTIAAFDKPYSATDNSNTKKQTSPKILPSTSSRTLSKEPSEPLVIPSVSGRRRSKTLDAKSMKTPPPAEPVLIKQTDTVRRLNEVKAAKERIEKMKKTRETNSSPKLLLSPVPDVELAAIDVTKPKKSSRKSLPYIKAAEYPLDTEVGFISPSATPPAVPTPPASVEEEKFDLEEFEFSSQPNLVKVQPEVNVNIVTTPEPEPEREPEPEKMPASGTAEMVSWLKKKSFAAERPLIDNYLQELEQECIRQAEMGLFRATLKIPERWSLPLVSRELKKKLSPAGVQYRIVPGSSAQVEISWDDRDS
eukprot:TRINITY_DN54215_c0_g1_i1.p1 TRINITY_DN54215_c0_g1~~TRINITY_DN54215_c0_g1_i1.p1  ORF type:complete len:453 (-),score=5.29 TRINITY_DN54215_c0_g1_i1:91-1350(-)